VAVCSTLTHRGSTEQGAGKRPRPTHTPLYMYHKDRSIFAASASLLGFCSVCFAPASLGVGNRGPQPDLCLGRVGSDARQWRPMALAALGRDRRRGGTGWRRWWCAYCKATANLRIGGKSVAGSRGSERSVRSDSRILDARSVVRALSLGCSERRSRVRHIHAQT
jgi:hypothetical protein